MRKRYPHTLRLLALIAVAAIFIGVSLLWYPAVWILIGAFWAGMLVLAIREDRKRQRT